PRGRRRLPGPRPRRLYPPSRGGGRQHRRHPQPPPARLSRASSNQRRFERRGVPCTRDVADPADPARSTTIGAYETSADPPPLTAKGCDHGGVLQRNRDERFVL